MPKLNITQYGPTVDLILLEVRQYLQPSGSINSTEDGGNQGSMLAFGFY